MAGASFGFNSSTTKNHSWIDPKTSAAQWGNFAGAQAIAPTYTPTSAAQIGSYYSPYADQVVDRSLAALDRSRQMAVNAIADKAASAHAFGGSRQGVAEALTNQGYADQAGQLAAQLYNQDYGQALSAAQHENEFGYQYPLNRQQLLDQSLGQITPQTFSKGRTTGVQFGFGGLGANYAGDLGKGLFSSIGWLGGQ
jgi:hypothetical protein